LHRQKAVCILLTLLHLGIKNIRLGPTLPAFVTPNALNVLVEKFNIMPISTAEKDLAACLEKQRPGPVPPVDGRFSVQDSGFKTNPRPTFEWCVKGRTLPA